MTTPDICLVGYYDEAKAHDDPNGPYRAEKVFFAIRHVDYEGPHQLDETSDACKALCVETDKDRAYRDDFVERFEEVGGKLDGGELKFGCMKDLRPW